MEGGACSLHGFCRPFRDLTASLFDSGILVSGGSRGFFRSGPEVLVCFPPFSVRHPSIQLSTPVTTRLSPHLSVLQVSLAVHFATDASIGCFFDAVRAAALQLDLGLANQINCVEICMNAPGPLRAAERQTIFLGWWCLEAAIFSSTRQICTAKPHFCLRHPFLVQLRIPWQSPIASSWPSSPFFPPGVPAPPFHWNESTICRHYAFSTSRIHARLANTACCKPV